MTVMMMDIRFNRWEKAVMKNLWGGKGMNDKAACVRVLDGVIRQ